MEHRQIETNQDDDSTKGKAIDTAPENEKDKILPSVFVSSRMDELREDRATAQKSICQAECRPLMFEIEPSWDDLKTELDNMMNRSDRFIGLYFTTAGHRGENIHMLTPIEYELYYFATRKVLALYEQLQLKFDETKNVETTQKTSENNKRKDMGDTWITHLEEICEIIGIKNEIVKSGSPHLLLSIADRGRIHSWRRALTEGISWLKENAQEEFENLRDVIQLFRRRSSNEWAGSVRLHQILGFWERHGFVKIYDSQQELYCAVLHGLTPKKKNQSSPGNNLRAFTAEYTVNEKQKTPGVIWAVSEILFQAGANIVAARSDAKSKLHFTFEWFDKVGNNDLNINAMQKKIANNRKKVIERVSEFLAPAGSISLSKLKDDINSALGRNTVKVETSLDLDNLQDECVKLFKVSKSWRCGRRDIILIAYHRNVPGVLQAMTRTIAMHRWTVKRIILFPKWLGLGFNEDVFSDLQNIRSHHTQTTILLLSRLDDSIESMKTLGAELEFALVDITGIERVLIFCAK